MFEMDGLAKESAAEALKSAAYKLAVKCKFIVK